MCNWRLKNVFFLSHTNTFEYVYCIWPMAWPTNQPTSIYQILNCVHTIFACVQWHTIHTIACHGCEIAAKIIFQNFEILNESRQTKMERRKKECRRNEERKTKHNGYNALDNSLNCTFILFHLFLQAQKNILHFQFIIIQMHCVVKCN